VSSHEPHGPMPAPTQEVVKLSQVIQIDKRKIQEYPGGSSPQHSGRDVTTRPIPEANDATTPDISLDDNLAYAR
jgi:hypothetical protein